MLRQAIVTVSLAGLAATASGEIVSATPDHYTLHHEATSPIAPDKLWERLLMPDSWWHPDHTYSGNAHHLWLNPQAGGVWLESWEGNSVEHGRVLAVMDGRMLRLDAPFGPLQGMGVQVIWTITLEPLEDGAGTRVIFDEVANGSLASGLDQLAPAVDGVKREAIERLTDPSVKN